MNRPHELEYFESHLAALLDKLRGLHSVHALAAVCDSIECTLIDEPLEASARRSRPRPAPNQLTALDLEEAAQRLFSAHHVTEEIQP